MSEVILVINPGSTSTKIGAFKGTDEIFQEAVYHPLHELRACESVYDQLGLRMETVQGILRNHMFSIASVDFIMARGGALRPIHGGVWRITREMLEDLKSARYGDHASSLGALIAWELAASVPDMKMGVADPPVVDEMDDVARITGHPDFVRKSRLHTLNQKAVAYQASTDLGISYSEARLVVAHLGGGISVGTHRDGRIVDVNDAYDGEGPFSPERSGTLPAGQLAEICFSGTWSADEIKRKMVGEGGVSAYLGTNDLKEVENLCVSGDEQAILVLDAMIYQIAKEIGAAATVLSGILDAVVITGSIAQSDYIISRLIKRVAFIGKLLVYPGENEMTALRDAALRVLSAKEKISTY